MFDFNNMLQEIQFIINFKKLSFFVPGINWNILVYTED